MPKRIDNSGAHWTPEQVEALRTFAASGVPTSVIALHLGRSETGVRAKAASVGVQVSQNIGGRAAQKRGPRMERRD